jgi:hypothetical protein
VQSFSIYANLMVSAFGAERGCRLLCNKYTASQKISIELFPLLCEYQFLSFFGKRVLPVLLLLQKSSGA